MTTETAPVPAEDFFIDVDDSYNPRELPEGRVRMGGKEYRVRCPKDSLPILLRRYEKDAEGKEEEIMRTVLASAFDPDDVQEIMERVLDPYERIIGVKFVMHTVQEVYKAYEPMMDEDYQEMGLENPMKLGGAKKPQDRLPSSKKQRPKAAPKKRAAALPSA